MYNHNMIRFKEKVIVSTILIIICISLSALFLLLFLKSEQKDIWGVWWWDNRLGSEYLEFASQENVSEIYYYTDSFTSKTNEFIGLANAKNIKVYWLAGEYEWIDDVALLKPLINDFVSYQSNFSNRFAGIHFDIEPHQHPDFDTKRLDILSKYINLIKNIRQNYPNIWIEYDIPFWLEDEITVDDITQSAYKFIIDYSDGVTVMSYRDSCQQIYDLALDEIDYALTKGKKINVGVETGGNSNSMVTFAEEGRDYMYQELRKLKQKLPKNVGIVIHHIYTWHHLKH